MKTLRLLLPEEVELDSKDTVKFLSAKLFEAGKLTLGQAAQLAGLSKAAFAEIVGDYGVSLFNYPASEIKKDAGKI